MSHVVELDLTPSDFREFYTPEPVAPEVSEPHWLLGAVYGRELLKAQLRKARPDLAVPLWRDAPELDTVLEGMVDQLGLRDWAQPVTMHAKVRYLRLVLAMKVAVEKNAPLPSFCR